MTHILRFAQVFALGTWLGSIVYLSFVVVPGAFSILSSRDQAGAVVAFALGWLHHLGVVAAVIHLVASFWLEPPFKALVQPAVLGVILMLLLTLASQKVVTPRMAALRPQMVSVNATPPDNPLHVEFDRLHCISVRLEGSVLLIGLAALFPSST